MKKWLKTFYILFCLSSISSMSGLDFFQTLITIVLLIDFIKNNGFEFIKIKITQIFNNMKNIFFKTPDCKKDIIQNIESKKFGYLLSFKSLNGIGYLYFVLWVVILLGWFLNAQPGFNWLEGIRKMKWIYNWYLMTVLFSLFPLRPSNIKWVSYVLFILGGYCLLVFIFGYDLFRGPEWSKLHMHPTSSVDGASVRANGFFTQPMTFAQTMLPLLMWISGLFLIVLKHFNTDNRKNNEYKKIFFWLTVAVLFAGLSVLLSFTRGVWLASAFGVVVMLFIISRKWLLIAALSGGLFLGVLYNFSSQFEERLSSAVNMNHSQHDERKLVWKTNIEMFKDYPILGIGWRDNTRRLDEYYDRLGISQETIKSHAHNQFIQFLSTTGISGLIVYLAIWGILFIQAFNNWKDLNFLLTQNKNRIDLIWMLGLTIGAIGCYVAFQVASMSETNFDDAKANYMLSFVIGSMVWVRAQLQTESL